MKEQMENSSEQKEKQTQDEVDFIEIFRKIWRHKKFLLWVTAIFTLLGLIAALGQPRRYTSKCVFVPQFSSGRVSGNISSLASLAGIDIDNLSNASDLTPRAYPFILDNVDYLKELMYTTITLKGEDTSVILLNYFTDSKYRKRSFTANLRKYTIGLPAVAVGGLKSLISSGKNEEMLHGNNDTTVVGENRIAFLLLNSKESKCAKIIRNNLNLTLNPKDGYITLEATMPEPLAAAEFGNNAFFLLQEYITNFKIEKSKSDLDFIEERYSEAKQDYENKAAALAYYKDKNTSLISSVAQTRGDRLKDEYDLSRNLYGSLASQRMGARISVKKDTPILTAVTPVSVPQTPSSTSRTVVLLMWIIVGFILSCGFILLIDYLRSTGIKCRWFREE